MVGLHKANAVGTQLNLIRNSTFWYGAAILACLTVFAINGNPLYYFDTFGYLEQGYNTLDRFGLTPKSESSTGGAASSAVGGGDAEVEDDDRTVSGSHAIIYSLLVAGFTILGLLDGMVFINIAVICLAVWLPARIAVRLYGGPVGTPAATAIPILAACIGSLPFYTAYLMPDIFAPALIIVVATATVFSGDMRMAEILTAFGLGLVAVVMHPSHLVMAALLLPFAVIVPVLFGLRRWWLAPLLLLLFVGLGGAERIAFRIAAQKIVKHEVTYRPILTARLINDGPGYTYLSESCPDPDMATCALYQALSWSDDPMRMTASHIVFASDPRLGSFLLMEPEDQKRVADEQVDFFLKVLVAHPIETTFAFIRNTLVQARYNSIDMTIPHEGIRAKFRQDASGTPPALEDGLLLGERDWIVPLTKFHQIIYGLSTLLIVVFVVLPRSSPRELKLMASLLVIGILANAFVCGGISQPADRYGARVAFLLPLGLAFLLIFLRRDRVDATRGGA